MALSIPSINLSGLGPGPAIPTTGSLASSLAALQSTATNGLFTIQTIQPTGSLSSRISRMGTGTNPTSTRVPGVAGQGSGTAGGTGARRTTSTGVSGAARPTGGAAGNNGTVVTVSSGVTAMASGSGSNGAAQPTGSAGGAGGAQATSTSRAAADRALGSVGWAAGAVMGVAGVVFAI